MIRHRRHETQELRPSRIFYRQNIGDYDRDDRHYAGTTRRTADNKDNKSPDNLQRRDRLDKDDGDNGRDRCVDFNDFQYSRISSTWRNGQVSRQSDFCCYTYLIYHVLHVTVTLSGLIFYI